MSLSASVNSKYEIPIIVTTKKDKVGKVATNKGFSASQEEVEMERDINDFELRASKQDKREGYSRLALNTFIRVDPKKVASLQSWKHRALSFMDASIFK